MLKNMDHAAYPKTMRSKSEAELRFICQDAAEAARVNPTGVNAGYYLDEVCYAANELYNRTPK